MPFEHADEEVFGQGARVAVAHPGDLGFVTHQPVQQEVGRGGDPSDERQRLLRGPEGGSPDAEVEAGIGDGHVDVQADGDAHARLPGDRLQMVDMLGRVRHQGDAAAACDLARRLPEVLRLPGGISDEQIVQPLFGEIHRFGDGAAHDAPEAVGGLEHELDHPDAAQGFAGEAEGFIPAFPGDAADVFRKEIQVEVGKGFGDALKARRYFRNPV